MKEAALRKSLVKLAKDNPDMRKDILPLLKEAAKEFTYKDWDNGLMRHVSPDNVKPFQGAAQQIKKITDDKERKKAIKTVLPNLQESTRRGKLNVGFSLQRSSLQTRRLGVLQDLHEHSP